MNTSSGERVADWMMSALVFAGVRHVFMVAGGGAMHLNDAAGAQPGLEVVCFQHEQAAAIAAEAYAKTSGELVLCLVTTGPGGTNAITGVAGAYLDSTPMLVVSGQVKRADRVGSSGVRQRGIQEVDICAVAGPLVKDARVIEVPDDVRVELERALWLAREGRPGPVWLDVPLDVQGAPVEPSRLRAFEPPGRPAARLAGAPLAVAAAEVAERLRAMRRPLLLAGAGVRLAGAEEAFRALAEELRLPVLMTWRAAGVLGDDHPLCAGRPGSLAERGPNFALQCADLVVCVGARLDLVTTGYDPKDFGRNACKVVVDIDPAELDKLEGAAEVRLCADAGEFLEALLGQVRAAGAARPEDLAPWRARCAAWRERYRLPDPAAAAGPAAGEAPAVSTYRLAETMCALLGEDDVLVPGSSGLGIEIFILAMRLRTGQRAVFTTGLGAMGYCLPAGIGASLAAGGRRTICVDGDAGLQLNIQELETLRRLALPVKLFVLANDGYASIRASQRRWFGRLTGADASSGFTLPSLEALTAAYGLPFRRIDPASDLADQLEAVLATPGPVVCEVPSPREEPREPVQVSERLPDGGMRSRPIEDLAPLLPRDELLANLDPRGWFPLRAPGAPA